MSCRHIKHSLRAEDIYTHTPNSTHSKETQDVNVCNPHGWGGWLGRMTGEDGWGGWLVEDMGDDDVVVVVVGGEGML